MGLYIWPITVVYRKNSSIPLNELQGDAELIRIVNIEDVICREARWDCLSEGDAAGQDTSFSLNEARHSIEWVVT